MMKALRELIERLDLYLARLELVAARTTETADLVRGLVVNQVLFSGSVTIPASGVFSLTFQAPFAAVAVYNETTGTITVTNSEGAAGPDGGAPGPGPGTVHVPANTYQQRNLAGRVVSIYAPAASVIELEVLARADTGR